MRCIFSGFYSPCYSGQGHQSGVRPHPPTFTFLNGDRHTSHFWLRDRSRKFHGIRDFHGIFRGMGGIVGKNICPSPEAFNAQSQKLGHAHVLTTLTSYRAVASSRQAEILGTLRSKRRQRRTGRGHRESGGRQTRFAARRGSISSMGGCFGNRASSTERIDMCQIPMTNTWRRGRDCRAAPTKSIKSAPYRSLE